MDRKIKSFIQFAKSELGVKSPTKIKLVKHELDPEATFGQEIEKGDAREIKVRDTGRNPNDVMRTIGHELTHAKQKPASPSLDREDQANIQAGRLMKVYNKRHPDMFKEDGAVGVGAIGGGGTTSNVPANSETGGGVKFFDPLLGVKRKKKRDK